MPKKDELTIFEKLSAIGCNITAKHIPRKLSCSIEIEETLLEASIAIQTNHDSRILGLLLSWVSAHGEIINMERLKKLVSSAEQSHRKIHWIYLLAHFGLNCGQSRWRIIQKRLPQGFELANEDLDFAKQRVLFKGIEPWAEGTGFVIAKRSEAIDSKFVLNSSQIAKQNTWFRNRLIFGSSWRADIITAMMFGAKNAYSASKQIGCSYEPAHRVFKEIRASGLKLNQL